MKNIKKIFLMLFMVVLLTGCVKYNIGMGVENNGGFTIDVIVGIDKQMQETANSTSDDSTDESDEKVTELKKKGYTCTEYKDDKFVGDKCTKTYSDINSVSTDKDVTLELTDIADDSKEDAKYFFNKNGTVYTAKFTIDATDDTDGSDQSIDMSSLAASMDLKYSVTLPVKATSHNAKTEESKDGKYVYTWEWEYGKVNQINFSWDMNNVSSVTDSKKDTKKETTEKKTTEKKKSSVPIVLIAVVGGVVLLLVIILVVIIIIASKGKKNKVMNQQPIGQPMSNQQIPQQPMTQPVAQPVEQPTQIVEPVNNAVDPEHPISYPSDKGSNV